jgi:hypothetical protein
MNNEDQLGLGHVKTRCAEQPFGLSVLCPLYCSVDTSTSVVLHSIHGSLLEFHIRSWSHIPLLSSFSIFLMVFLRDFYPKEGKNSLFICLLSKFPSTFNSQIWKSLIFIPCWQDLLLCLPFSWRTHIHLFTREQNRISQKCEV